MELPDKNSFVWGSKVESEEETHEDVAQEVEKEETGGFMDSVRLISELLKENFLGGGDKKIEATELGHDSIPDSQLSENTSELGSKVAEHGPSSPTSIQSGLEGKAETEWTPIQAQGNHESKVPTGIEGQKSAKDFEQNGQKSDPITLEVDSEESQRMDREEGETINKHATKKLKEEGV